MRRRDPTEAFELDSADIELLMAKLRAPAGTAEAMRPRLREFQKRMFPKLASVGRGKRITYDMSETLRIATAFELVDIDLSTSRCINVVEQNRRALDRLFVGAWRILHEVDDGRLKRPELEGERRRLTMHVALSASTCDAGFHVVFGDLSGDARPEAWPGRRSHISIDIAALVAETVTVLQGKHFRLLPDETDAAFLQLGIPIFKNGAVDTWEVGALKPNSNLVGRPERPGAQPARPPGTAQAT